jgi:hypothetical protein
MRFYGELRNQFAPILKDIGYHIKRVDFRYGKKDFPEKGNRPDWRSNKLRSPSIPVAGFETTEDAQKAAKELEIKYRNKRLTVRGVGLSINYALREGRSIRDPHYQEFPFGGSD